MRYISIILLVVCFICLSLNNAFAVSITLSNLPAAIGIDEFTFSASISGATSGTNYLRVDLFKDGTSNYFGETYTGVEWYSGAEANHYFPVTIQSGIGWSGQMRARITSLSSSVYDGLGTYKIRVRRYTASGNYNSDEANSNAQTIVIVYPTITPMPTETPVPTPTQIASTPTALPPTQKPSSVPTLTLKPTLTAFPSSTPFPVTIMLTPDEIRGSSLSSVLGITSSVDPTDPPSLSHPVVAQTADPFGVIILSCGGVFLLACGILAFYTYRKQ